MTLRFWLLASGWIWGCCFSPLVAAKNFRLEFIGEKIIPTGTRFNETTVGGLSGLDYDADRGVYYAISDDRSPDARFYTLNIRIDRSGMRSVEFLAVTRLLDVSGHVYQQNDLDPEAIRYDPVEQSLYWSSERDRNGDPWVRQMRLDGSFLRELGVPAKFKPSASASSGVADNKGFEALALDGNGRLVAATEQALLQDTLTFETGRGSPARIAVWAASQARDGSALPQREFVYLVDPVVRTVSDGFAENGLVECLVLNNRYLLTVEREFIQGVGYNIKVFEADYGNADDVSGKARLNGEETAVHKELLLDLGTLDIAARRDAAFSYLQNALDNIEGVALGPSLHGGKTLIFVSDDNFNAFDNGIDGDSDDQFTQFLAFSLKPIRMSARRNRLTKPVDYY